MSDERMREDEALDGPDFLLEDESDDLETAFREALEVVERTEDEEIAPRDEARPDEPGARQAPVLEGTDQGREIEDLRERLVRTLADFDNYRKRVERERSELRKYEGFGLLREFLGIVDNLERATESEGPVEDLKTGLRLILRQIQEVLARSGVQRVPTVGEPFDPRVHEAISRHEEAEVEEPMVSDELQPGYEMHDRLLRPARVRVAMPPSTGESGRQETVD